MIIYSYLSYIVTKIYNFHRYASWKQHALGRSRYLQQVAVVLILLLSTAALKETLFFSFVTLFQCFIHVLVHAKDLGARGRS